MWETCRDLYTHSSSTSWHVLLPFLISMCDARHSCANVENFVWHSPFICKISVQTTSHIALFLSISDVFFSFVVSLALALSLPLSLFSSVSLAYFFSVLISLCCALFSFWLWLLLLLLSFVIWSRAKYWIRHKWYYFMLYSGALVIHHVIEMSELNVYFLINECNTPNNFYK